MEKFKIYHMFSIIFSLFLLTSCENKDLKNEVNEELEINTEITAIESMEKELGHAIFESREFSIIELLEYDGAIISRNEKFKVDEIEIDSMHYGLDLNEGIRKNEEFPSGINLSVHYPQITSFNDKDLEERINWMILDTILKPVALGGSLMEVKERLDLIREEMNTVSRRVVLGGDIKYEILFCDDEYISLLINGGIAAGGVGASFFEYLVTIDLKAGSHYNLNITNINEIEDAIKLGNFEVISGSYLPGGPDYYEIVGEIIEKIDLNFEENMGELKNYQKIRTENGVVEFENYETNDIRNFAFDKDGIFISFYFDDTLDGYLTLKIPRKYCESIELP